MATDAALLLKIEAAIEAITDALIEDSMVEYDYNGRRYKRAEFDRLLDSLFRQRANLKKMIAASGANRVRVAKLGNARRVG